MRLILVAYSILMEFVEMGRPLHIADPYFDRKVNGKEASKLKTQNQH